MLDNSGGVEDVNVNNEDNNDVENVQDQDKDKDNHQI